MRVWGILLSSQTHRAVGGDTGKSPSLFSFLWGVEMCFVVRGAAGGALA